ncbi:MAG: uroporphyrinogen-III C-methyltransferase [Terriglobia bacterium]
MSGIVYLVGAGPGDPGLLTLKGKALLERADCVIYDFLANEELLRYTRPDCRRLYAGKRAGRHTMTQDHINRLLVDYARRGETVVRLKGGDPFIFGRGGEEAMSLAEAGVAFHVVPGVCSGHAAPAYAGIPLTHRDYASSVAFLTAHGDEALEAGTGTSPHSDTLVFFMGARNLAEITAMLLREGRPPSTPAAVIRWGTTPDQKVVTGALGDIAAIAGDIAPPPVAVIGKVVNLREQLSWFERLPLFGKRVLVTRPREQAASLRDALAERGAQPVELPTLEIRDPESWQPLDNAIERLDRFDYLLVTSINGVRKFLARLRAAGRDVRALKGIEIGAIGPATAAEFAASGVRVDFIPQQYRAEGLLAALEGRDLQGKAFLIPRARLARDLVPRALSARGSQVEVVEAYYAALPDYRPEEVEALLTPPPDALTFTSSSTVLNFRSLLLQEETRAKLAAAAVVSIGPVTSATLQSLGMKVDAEARESTTAGLVEALEGHFRRA